MLGRASTAPRIWIPNGTWSDVPPYGTGLAADQCGSGLGSVSGRPLGLGRLVWLDVGELRSLGLGALSLRPLVLSARLWLGLVSRADRRPALLVAGAGRILRFRGGGASVSASVLATSAGFRWRLSRSSTPGGAAVFTDALGSTGNLNITNVNISNVYRNAQFRNGISAVAARDFQNGRFNNVIRTSGAQVGSAGVIRGQMPFTAGAQNLRFSDRQATAIPRGSQNTRFFTQQQPNPVQRGQMNLAGRQTTQQAVSPTNRTGNAQNSDAGGWRRFGSPSAQPSRGQGNQPSVNRNGSAGTAQAQRNDRPSTSSQGGWQRFGAPAGGSSPSQSPTPARQNFRSSPNQAQRFGAPGGGGALRIAPPVVRERPSNSAPRQSAPSYNSAPRQSAPAPRSSGGSSSRGNSGNSHSSGHNR